MRLAHQIHVITAVGAMLLMTMGLTIAYGCDEGNVLELALRVYLRPLAECMGRAEDARPLALYSVACIERWKQDNLADMQQRFSQKPLPQPIIYLRISNVTLLGAADDVLQYRKRPKVYVLK